MKITLLRYSQSMDRGGSTLGILGVNGRFFCYTLENPLRKGPDSRIPPGAYKLVYRRVGAAHEKYKDLYPDIHKGMLEVAGVPGRSAILIHRGNTERDTKGCILLGDGVNNNLVKQGLISESSDAYERFYRLVGPEMGGIVTFRVVDEGELWAL